MTPNTLPSRRKEVDEEFMGDDTATISWLKMKLQQILGDKK